MKASSFLLFVIIFSFTACSDSHKETIYDGPDNSEHVTSPFVIQQEPDYLLIQKGDNLWNLATETWGEPEWQRFFENNQFLNEPGRLYEDQQGKTIVIVYPNEVLTLAGVSDTTPIATRLVVEQVTTTHVPWWMWASLCILLICLGLILPNKKLERSATTQGPPVVPGGLTDETVGDHFRNQLNNEPGGENVVIARMRSGKFYSDGVRVPIEYGDHPRMAILNGEKGYTATVVLPNGEFEERLTLQECGNDVRTGKGLHKKNVRFVPDEVQSEILKNEPERIVASTVTQAKESNQPITDEMIREKVQKGINLAKAGYTKEEPLLIQAMAKLPSMLSQMPGYEGEVSADEDGNFAIHFKSNLPVVLLLKKNSNHVAEPTAEKKTN